MILEFSFTNLSTSLVLEKILLKILNEHKLEGKLAKKDDKLSLFTISDSADKLEAFANALSSEIPHSIFLKGSDVKVVDSITEDEYKLIETEKRVMPYCPKCLKEVTDKDNKNYYNPFHSCEVCGYGIKKQPITLKNFAKIVTANSSEEYKSLFEKVAALIKNGAVIKIKTFYGEYFIGKIDEKNTKDMDFDIICTDLASVEKYTAADKSEILAIAAIEKPFLKLKTNHNFKSIFPFIQKEGFRFKLADDLMLYLISYELSAIDENLFFITKNHKETKIELTYEEDIKTIEPLECVAIDDKVVILKGDRSILPPVAQSHNEIEPCHKAFFSIIGEYNLFDKSICGAYLSKNHPDKIMLYSKKFGLVNYLSFEFDFDSIEEIYEKISATDETGKKLVKNYKDNFEDIYKETSKIKLKGQCLNVYRLWGIVSLILGYTNESDLKKAARVIEDNAFNFLGKKGPLVDYKLKKVDSKVYLDPLRTIRSAMSYRLADVDPKILSFGVIESFAEFISNRLDEAKKEMQLEAVTANGSLLEIKLLIDKLNKNITKNHTLLFNKELPVDEANLGYGETFVRKIF